MYYIILYYIIKIFILYFTVAGCRFTQQDTFIEQDKTYIYTSRGTDYICSCEKTSAYRYQLTCSGRRKVDRTSTERLYTTILPPRHGMCVYAFSTVLPVHYDISDSIVLVRRYKASLSLISIKNQSACSTLDLVLDSQSELIECRISIIGSFQ